MILLHFMKQILNSLANVSSSGTISILFSVLSLRQWGITIIYS